MPVRLSVSVQAGRLEFDKRLVGRSLVAAGREIASVAKRMIANSERGGRLYRGPGGSAARYRGGYVRGAHRASVPGQAPARVTGTLGRDLVVRPFRSGEGVAIRDTAFYSLFLESGAHGGGRIKRAGQMVRGKSGIGQTRELKPRPFLSAALEQRETSIAARIAESVNSGLKFVRVKP
ncbi:MAG: hypothetical protein ACREE3_12390 [Stellaceae bacterium]